MATAKVEVPDSFLPHGGGGSGPPGLEAGQKQNKLLWLSFSSKKWKKCVLMICLIENPRTSVVKKIKPKLTDAGRSVWGSSPPSAQILDRLTPPKKTPKLTDASRGEKMNRTALEKRKRLMTVTVGLLLSEATSTSYAHRTTLGLPNGRDGKAVGDQR